MKAEELKKTAVGKWRGILESLGVKADLSGKHSPCPLCGGKDRFRFDDKNGSGGYICNQCGAGDSLALIQGYFGCGFEKTLEMVAEKVGHVEQVKSDVKNLDVKKLLNETWKAAKPIEPGDMVMNYLMARNLLFKPDNIRFHPACYEKETKSKMPAMIARIQGPDGKPVTIHRTYLCETGKANIQSPKKLMPYDGVLEGAAIRLFKPGNILGVAEGIETAIAARQLFDVPVWACVSSAILESFVPPEGVRQITVFADNDQNFTGQKAAYKLANRLFIKGFIVDVEVPPIVGDWADVNLKEKRTA